MRKIFISKEVLERKVKEIIEATYMKNVSNFWGSRHRELRIYEDGSITIDTELGQNESDHPDEYIGLVYEKDFCFWDVTKDESWCFPNNKDELLKAGAELQADDFGEKIINIPFYAIDFYGDEFWLYYNKIEEIKKELLELGIELID